MDIKKPRLGFPVRGFRNLVWCYLDSPLTRTSVGNKKYEYEYKNRNLTRAHKTGDQRELALRYSGGGGVAMRHVTDHKRAINRSQYVSSKYLVVHGVRQPHSQVDV
jgi:hypothetical protein